MQLTEAQHVLVVVRVAYAADGTPLETVFNVLPSRQWRLSYEWAVSRQRTARASDEASQVAWLTVEEAIQQMPEARAVRATDAVSGTSPAVRIHDGTHLL